MFEKKLYYFICSILLVGHIHGEIMKKSDVLKIDPQKFNEMPGFDNCPKYSVGNVNFNKCSFNFYCKGDECSSDTINGTEFQFSNNKTLIVETCNFDFDEDCTTERCQSDSDCLSNKCIKNSCSVNKDMPVIQCMDIEIYDKKTSKFITKMNCGKAKDEFSSSEDQCASHSLTDGVCIYNGRSIEYNEINGIYNNTVTMKKEDVLKLEIEKYNNFDDDIVCPKYYLDWENFNRCNVRFYCRGEECTSVNGYNRFVYFKNKDGKVEKFITDIVDENLLKYNELDDNDIYSDKYRTIKCNNNSDCLSNKCVSNVCVSNPSNSITECLDINTYNLLKFKYTGKVHCGKATNEKCSNDGECASNECSDGYCIRVYHDYYMMGAINTLFLIFCFIVLIIIIAIISCCCCIRKRSKAKNNKTKNNNSKV